MRLKQIVMLVALFAMAASLAWATDNKSEAVARLGRATKTLEGLTTAADKGIPNEVLKGAKCMVIIPNLTKGGFIVAAKHGKGVATCRLPNGDWSAPAFVSISGGSWGAQLGIEDIHLVVFVMNADGVRDMLHDKFQVDANASAAAGPIGRTASAGTDWTANTEFLTYSRTKGLFAGVDLGGSVIEADKETDRALYGKEYTNTALLTGQVTPPREARGFLDEIAGAKADAKHTGD